MSNGEGRVGWGRTGSGLGTDGEWVGDGKRAGCRQKGSGLGTEGVWNGDGTGVD